MMGEGEDRSSWLAARKLGIGGSDIAAIYNEGFGCRRALFYEKTDTEPDSPELEPPLLRLGRWLEEFFAIEYANVTGRTLARCETAVDPVRPWRRANPDRRIIAGADQWFEDHGPGGVEIKSLDPAFFRQVRRDGVKEYVIRQVHWSGALSGVPWMAFVLGDRGSGEILHFDHLVDHELYEQMGEAVDTFWRDYVQAGLEPDPLPDIGDVCKACRWRRRCRGTHMLGQPAAFERAIVLEEDDSPELDNAVSDLAQCKQERDEAEARLDEAKAVVVAYLVVLDNEGREVRVREAVKTLNDAKLYYRLQQRTTWDGRALEQLAPVLVVPATQLTQARDALAAQGITVEQVSLRERYKLMGNQFRALRVYPPT